MYIYIDDREAKELIDLQQMLMGKEVMAFCVDAFNHIFSPDDWQCRSFFLVHQIDYWRRSIDIIEQYKSKNRFP